MSTTPRTMLAAPLERGADAFDFLLGSWRFSRRIPGHALIRGEAIVRRDGDADQAEYEEVAQVQTVRGATLRATQRYRFCRAADGISIWRQPGGELFHELTFALFRRREWSARAVHRCGEDIYQSMYRLGAGRRFRVLHDVSGPRKQYRSYTVYAAV